MPELPEVETIRKSLQGLIGRNIRSIRFSNVAPVETTTPARIRKALSGKTIDALQRRGKYLILWGKATGLVFHLGMSGKLLFHEQTKLIAYQHTHLVLRFQDGSALYYVDPRRFGTLSLTHQPNGQDNPFLAKLGSEFDDPALTAQTWILKCRRHQKLSLKNLLLHQGVIAGLGNIYACEVLYRAGLKPTRKVQNTTNQQLAGLLAAIRGTLQLGIQHGGTTLRDYVTGLGAKGEMKKLLQVYDRAGKKTLDRKGTVTRIVQQNRSTWFCPTVQK